LRPGGVMLHRIYICHRGSGAGSGARGDALLMTPFAKTLKKDSRVRRYEILPDANGWRVLEREDSRVIREAVYNDWHRVERARRAFVIEMTSLRNEGWTDARP
jgi:hypothetical protein